MKGRKKNKQVGGKRKRRKKISKSNFSRRRDIQRRFDYNLTNFLTEWFTIRTFPGSDGGFLSLLPFCFRFFFFSFVYHSIEFLIVSSFNFSFRWRERFSLSTTVSANGTDWNRGHLERVAGVSFLIASRAVLVCSLPLWAPIPPGPILPTDHLTRHCLHLQIARLSANCSAFWSTRITDRK